MYSRTFIVCEGKSEYAYVQELNRYLREKDIRHYLCPEDAQGGKPDRVKSAYNRIRQRERNPQVLIWVDEDIYFRDSLELPPHLKELCCFTHWNFEDFLVLHCEHYDITKWVEVCSGANHFLQPLHGERVETLLKEHIFPDYKKGELPSKMCTITGQVLRNLFKNHEDSSIPMQANLAPFIKKLISPANHSPPATLTT